MITEKPFHICYRGKGEVEEGGAAAPFPHHQDLPDDEGEQERESQVDGAHHAGNDPLGGAIEPVSILKALLTGFLDLKTRKVVKMYI